MQQTRFRPPRFCVALLVLGASLPCAGARGEAAAGGAAAGRAAPHAAPSEPGPVNHHSPTESVLFISLGAGIGGAATGFYEGGGQGMFVAPVGILRAGLVLSPRLQAGLELGGGRQALGSSLRGYRIRSSASLFLLGHTRPGGAFYYLAGAGLGLAGLEVRDEGRDKGRVMSFGLNLRGAIGWEMVLTKNLNLGIELGLSQTIQDDAVGTVLSVMVLGTYFD